jgi:hypothetical protein
MTILRTDLHAPPGTVWHTAAPAERFRAMFLTLREYNSNGLLALLEDPACEPLLAKAVRETLNDASPWWAGEEYQEVCAWLDVLMQACAPADHYWGPHPDDPNNHGYWPIKQEPPK